MAELESAPNGITGIVLAGGESSRMGTDKSFVVYRGKYLIEHVIGVLQNHCETVLISANSARYSQFGLKTVPDRYKNCGPAGGIFSALVESETVNNLVVGCDMPFISPELIALLLENAGNSDCVIPVHGGKTEPVVALYRKSALPEIEKCLVEGIFKLHRIIDLLDSKRIDVSTLLEKNPALFRNFNSPDDLA